MSMKSASAPRRLYMRSGALIVSYAGMFFGPPARAKSEIIQAHPVTIEVQKRKGGKARIAVTQMVDADKTVTENWVEQHLTYTTRSPKTASETPASHTEGEVSATV